MARKVGDGYLLTRVVLDGAHNPAGALVLKEALEKAFQYQHLILLIGY